MLRRFPHLSGAPLVCLGIAAGCGGASDTEVAVGSPTAGAVAGAPAPPVYPPASTLTEPTAAGEEATSPSGLIHSTIRAGEGAQAREGDRVTIHYTATIQGGDALDNTRDGEPWTYEIGDKRAVDGFNQGVAGMKVGEVRRLIVPPNLAFGALGTFGEYAPGQPRGTDGALRADEAPSIPPNTTVVYEIELIAIESGDRESHSDDKNSAAPDADAPPP